MFRQTCACLKADEICFLGQEESAEGGIHAAKEHKFIEQHRKTCIRPFITKGMCQHATTCSQALLEHFSWELFEHPHCSPDLTLE
jgi:hypothetical protein